MIRGWANYHRHIVAKGAYAKVDYAIFKKLWQWACLKSPSKSRRWIKDRYFIHLGTRAWVFGVKGKDGNGKERLSKLARAGDTPIRRHVKIRGEANPYDPKWEEYFEERLSRTMKEKLQDRKRWLRLWLNQKGRCPVCHEVLAEGSGWHVQPPAPQDQRRDG